MITNLFRPIRYFSAVLLTLGLASSCAQPEVQLKPWGSNLLSKIEFSFSDVDMDKGEIAGDLILDIPSDVKPADVTSYVVYWSSSSGKSGKGTRLTEVPASFTGKILYKVPENTAVPAGKGDYFLLYLKAASGEVASGKSVRIADKFAAAPKAEQQAEAAPTDTEQPVADTSAPTQPTDTPTTSVATPVVATPDTPATQAPVDQTAPEASQQQTIDGVPVILIKNVLFEFDKSYLGADFKAQLRKDFAKAQNKAEMKLLIAGHADERGSNEYNLALGERRAYAVKRYLIRLGFAAENIRIISYGEEKPLDPAHNEEAWAKNRRSETIVND